VLSATSSMHCPSFLPANKYNFDKHFYGRIVNLCMSETLTIVRGKIIFKAISPVK